MKSLDAAVKQLQSHLTTLEAERKRVMLAIHALNYVSKKTEPAPAEPKKRHRGYVYKATCLRCGNLFKAKRSPNPQSPSQQSKVLFCHKPCVSSMYRREQRTLAQKQAAMAQSRKGTTLFPGDTLTPISKHN